jgi:hypothetical protein
MSRAGTRSSSRTALSSITDGVEMKFSDFKGTIGIYKHGRIQWKQEDDASIAGSRSSSTSGKSRRPKIQVVIPKTQRDRPLPTSPFFGHLPFKRGKNTAGDDTKSASVEIMTIPMISELDGEGCQVQPTHHDVSPPSCSKKTFIRDSVVSPLSAQQMLPTIQFHPLVIPEATKEEPESESSSQHNVPANSSDESHDDDGSSIYSERSSMTSVEGNSLPNNPKLNYHARSASAFSITSPVKAGIFDGEANDKSVGTGLETRHELQSPSYSPPRRYAPHPPIEEDSEFVPSCVLRPLRTSTLQRRPTTKRRSSGRNSVRRSLSTDPSMGVLNQAASRSSSKQFSRNTPSPTLSEAENDLEQHLTSFTEEAPATSFTEDNPFKWDEVVPRKESVAITNDVSGAAPALPRKSSKRQSIVGGPNFRLSRVPCDHIASQLKRNRSMNKTIGLSIEIPGKTEKPKRMADSFVLSPISIPVPPRTIKRTITPASAENVILTILRNLESLDDLFATAVVNRGFYRVFKRHELDLMKTALRKMSPPAWENREICYPGHDEVDAEDLDRPRRDYTPTTYLQYYTRDMYIIAALKSLIKDKCESFLRPEMCMALVSTEPAETSRVDDALWRIWTFCKIFGAGKGREEDIVAQMDWLKGGVLVHQKTCTYSIFTTDDMNETLASAPECFAKGNEGGLTAEELFDMMELWNCLGVLLQPFEGRTIQAREFGVYEATDVRGGDIDGEELMLDEWYYYLLTLGLSAILDLAAPCRQEDASAFILASQNGWIDWKPPVFGGTRRNFLKEAASRVYEDKIAVTYAESSSREVQRQLSKQRIQRHISELRQRKNSNERLPPIRMSQERPMSEWEDVMNNLTRPRPPPSTANNIASHIHALRAPTPSSNLAQQLTISIPEMPASRTPPPPSNIGRLRAGPDRIVAQPLLPTPPPSTVPSVSGGDRRSSMAPSVAPTMPSIDEHPAFRSRSDAIPEMPALDQHPAFRQHLDNTNGNHNRNSPSVSSNSSNNRSEEHAAFQQHQIQQRIYGSDAAENTADKAVYRIVEMGFTAEQARHALKMTDLGDGLRVDRAVELLLRGD